MLSFRIPYPVLTMHLLGMDLKVEERVDKSHLKIIQDISAF